MCTITGTRCVQGRVDLKPMDSGEVTTLPRVSSRLACSKPPPQPKLKGTQPGSCSSNHPSPAIHLFPQTTIHAQNPSLAYSITHHGFLRCIVSTTRALRHVAPTASAYYHCDRILTRLSPCSRIVNLVAGGFMVLGGIAHFFPIHM
jgi:hypothetical protein